MRTCTIRAGPPAAWQGPRLKRFLEHIPPHCDFTNYLPRRSRSPEYRSRGRNQRSRSPEYAIGSYWVQGRSFLVHIGQARRLQSRTPRGHKTPHFDSSRASGDPSNFEGQTGFQLQFRVRDFGSECEGRKNGAETGQNPQFGV